jgi:hypothetical protein
MKFEQWFLENREPMLSKPLILRELLKDAWQASRENQQELNLTEFCRDMDCEYLYKQKSCVVYKIYCTHTAKEFHHWLRDNGYRIVKG